MLSLAAAAATLALFGEMARSAADTENAAAIARALSTGYECFHDDSPTPPDDATDSDLDSSSFPEKKIDETDCTRALLAPVQLHRALQRKEKAPWLQVRACITPPRTFTRPAFDAPNC